jgi:hypothetical protein
MEVDNGAAFLKLAKDLSPVGKVIMFEKSGKGRFKFLTKQHDELLAVCLTIQESPYPVTSAGGEVDHEIHYNAAMLSNRDDLICHQDIFRKLAIETRLAARVKSLSKGLSAVLRSSKTTRMDWKKASKNPNILKLKVSTTISRKKHQVVVNVKYTDQHTKALSEMLEKAGFMVVGGRIT